MTFSEFSSQFDILYNNTTSNQAPDLNEYEKSVFATKAEYEVLKNYFRVVGNPKQEGYDDSYKREVDFSKLIKESTNVRAFPNDVLIILREEVLENGVKKIVVPISDVEYNRLSSKPYKRPLKNQVWRIKSSTHQLVGHYDNSTLSNYKLTYVRLPKPIILWDTTDTDFEGLTIDGYPTGTVTVNDFDLPEEIIPEVLQRAVELAKIAWQGDLNATLTGGQRSE